MKKSLKEFKYKTSFSSIIRSVLPEEEYGKMIAKASLEDLKKIIPEEVKQKEDLLPIAFNACTVNLVNKNNDVMSTETALKVYKDFIHKQINWEHNRDMVVGHIVSAALSKFDTNYAIGAGSEIIQESDVAGKLEPFNIALGGVIYKVVNQGLCDALEVGNDPQSSKYMAYSTSWEILFDSYALAVGNKNLAECEIITDPDKINELSVYSFFAGGEGKTPDGRYIYRLITGDVVPLGIGLTVAPAGTVQGIVVDNPEEKGEEDDGKEGEASLNKSNKSTDSQKNISQSHTIDVKPNNKIMKTITTYAEVVALTDESVKEYSIAGLRDILETKIAEVTKDYSAKLEEKEKAAKAAQEEAAQALEQIKTVSKELAEIKEKQAIAEAQEKFNTRMALLDSEYDLEDEDRKVIAADIKDLDDATFEKWMASFTVLAKSKNKKVKSQMMEDEKKKNAPCTCGECAKCKEKAKASIDEENAKKEAEKALANATASTAVTIPNTTNTGETMADKYRAAFSSENVVLKK